MSTEDNKALIRHCYEALNRKDFAAYQELLAPDVTYNEVALGREGLRQFSTTLRTTFPDLRIAVEEMIAEGDLVAAYITWGGTHLAELRTPALGRLAPTGRSFTAKAMDLYRIRGGQIAEIRDSPDRLALLQQLGVLSTPVLATT
jgi:steroid delta-isomerase-like uncharacterized protein